MYLSATLTMLRAALKATFPDLYCFHSFLIKVSSQLKRSQPLLLSLQPRRRRLSAKSVKQSTDQRTDLPCVVFEPRLLTEHLTEQQFLHLWNTQAQYRTQCHFVSPLKTPAWIFMCAANHRGLPQGRISGGKNQETARGNGKRRSRLGRLGSGDGRRTTARRARGDADIMSTDRNLTGKGIRLERKWKKEMKRGKKQGQGGEKDTTGSFKRFWSRSRLRSLEMKWTKPPVMTRRAKTSAVWWNQVIQTNKDVWGLVIWLWIMGKNSTLSQDWQLENQLGPVTRHSKWLFDCPVFAF